MPLLLPFGCCDDELLFTALPFTPPFLASLGDGVNSDSDVDRDPTNETLRDSPLPLPPFMLLRESPDPNGLSVEGGEVADASGEADMSEPPPNSLSDPKDGS